MPIWNLTTEEETEPTIYDLLGYADIKCYKGSKKTGTGENTRPGTDLKDKIRVVTSHRRAIGILKQLWGKPNGAGAAINNDPFAAENNLPSKPQCEWHRDELQIYLALEDPDLTFETAMKAFNATGVQHVCDRRTIHKESVEITTHKGKRQVLKSCDKPCALAESDPDDWDCPLGCKPDGILHFYLRECLDNDAMIHSQFETKAWGDVPKLIKKIRAIKKEFGSITESPVPCHWTRHKIPLIISRVMRNRKRPATELKPENEWKGRSREYRYTGKKGDADFYDLDIEVDPVWQDWYRKQKLLEELRSRGLNPSQKIVVGLLSGDPTIDVQAITSSVIEIPALPPAVALEVPLVEEGEENVEEEATVPPEFGAKGAVSVMPKPISKRLVREEQILQLEDALINKGWTEEAIALLLTEHKISEPQEMTQEQWVVLCDIASSAQSAREYNDAALAPGTVTVMPAYVTQKDFQEQIYPVFKEHGWVKISPQGKPDNRAIVDMLLTEYEIKGMGELLVTQIPEILELAAMPEVRDRWLNRP